LATVAIDTFITELSSVIKNWPDAKVNSTIPEALAARSLDPVTPRTYQQQTAAGPQTNRLFVGGEAWEVPPGIRAAQTTVDSLETPDPKRRSGSAGLMRT
jgi:hypothetical protein